MSRQIAITISESSQVGDVRRTAVRLAESAHFTDSKKSDVAITATELANNIVRHAGEGIVLLQLSGSGERTCLEVLAIDSGPGMRDVTRCLEDGYSTVGTAGTGLGAVRRLSSDFDVYSVVDQGTVIVSRVAAGKPKSDPEFEIEIAGISTPVPPEIVCGDAWSHRQSNHQFNITVVDGLGHGEGAHEAASAAIGMFETTTSNEPTTLLSQAHRALQGTRGAAMAVARIDLAAGLLQYTGVGNIAGTLISSGESRGLMSHNGILGAQNPKIHQLDFPWVRSALLIMHSDGLQSRWRLDLYPGLTVRHPAVIAGVLYRDFQRGRDDATVVVVRMTASHG